MNCWKLFKGDWGPWALSEVDHLGPVRVHPCRHGARLSEAGAATGGSGAGRSMIHLKRDKHKCKLCGSEECVHAHHKLSIMEHPEEVFNVENGMTLCEKCHKTIH